jgi:hypothetical protein
VDIVGKRFGKQVVLRELGNNYVEILCDCGTKKRSRKQYLLNGQSRSCGCGKFADRSAPVSVGDRFDHLVVVQKLGTDGQHRSVLALCDCGRHKVFRESDLRGGESKSCGCFRRTRASSLTRTHGQTRKHYLYSIWQGMWERTRRSDRWPSYARQGITVAPEWRAFEAFRDYVEQNLGERPKGFTLDRIENDKDYAPGNLRWADARTQMRNRSNSVFITVDGVSRCIAGWAEATGISSTVICSRRKNGWSDRDAVLTPVRKKK